jgi:hypothetical protein
VRQTLSRRKSLELDVRACAALDAAKSFCREGLLLKRVSDSTLIRYAVNELLAEEVAAIQADGSEDDRLALRTGIQQASRCRNVPQPPAPEEVAMREGVAPLADLTEQKVDAMLAGDQDTVEAALGQKDQRPRAPAARRTTLRTTIHTATTTPTSRMSGDHRLLRESSVTTRVNTASRTPAIPRLPQHRHERHQAVRPRKRDHLLRVPAPVDVRLDPAGPGRPHFPFGPRGSTVSGAQRKDSDFVIV